MTNIVGMFLLAAGATGAATFIVLYTMRAQWWHTELGWHLVVFPGSLGLLLTNGLVFRLVGDYPGRDVVNLVLFVVLVAAVWWRVALLVKANRDPDPDPDPPDRERTNA